MSGFPPPPPPPPPPKGMPGNLPIRQTGIRIQDITPPTLIDAKAALEKLTTYGAHTIRKAPPQDPKKQQGTWARAEIVEERFAQEQILKRIKELNEGSRSVTDKKTALVATQQGQITALLDNLISSERDRAFQWSLVQLDIRQKPVSTIWKQNRRLHETVSITAYVKRAPQKDLNPIMLLQNIERNKAESMRPPPAPNSRPGPLQPRPGTEPPRPPMMPIPSSQAGADESAIPPVAPLDLRTSDPWTAKTNPDKAWIDTIQNDSADSVAQLQNLLDECESSASPYSFLKEKALLFSIRLERVLLFQVLLERDVDVEAMGATGNRALHKACLQGNLFMVDKLLDGNTSPDIESKNDQGCTPLHLASKGGHREVVERLLSNKPVPANVDAKIPSPEIDRKIPAGWTPLIFAASEGHSDTVQILLDHGASMTEKGGKEETPLLAAVQNSKQRVVSVLLNADGFTKEVLEAEQSRDFSLLHTAAANGDKGIAELLIDKKFSTELRTSNGYTPLLVAANSSKEQLIKLLLEKSANITAQDSDDNNVIHLACQGFEEEQLKRVLGMLLKYGADFYAKNKDGETGLYWVLYFSFENLAIELLQSTPQVTLGAMNARTKYTDTPLFIAVRRKLDSISVNLLKKGARMGSDDGGVDPQKNTILHWAAQNNMSGLIKYAIDNRLLQQNDIFKKNSNGFTPPHLAAMGAYEYTARLLLSFGGAENQQTTNWKALHWAVYMEDVNMVKLLVIHGPEMWIREQDSVGRTPEELHNGIASLKGNEGSAHFQILDWLQTSVNRTQPEIPELKIPTPPCGAREIVCRTTSLYIMDFQFLEGHSYTVEKKNPVFDVVYRRGPDDAMDIAAQRQLTMKAKEHNNSYDMSESGFLDSGSDDKEGMDVNQPSIRWIHLPFNNRAWVNDLMQMIYYKKSSDDGSERHDHFRLKNFVDEGWAQQEMIPNGNFMKPYFKCLYPRKLDDNNIVLESTDKLNFDDASTDNSNTTAGSSHRSDFDSDSKSGKTISAYASNESTPDLPRNCKAILHMPYLTFETLGGVDSMNSTIKRIRNPKHIPRNYLGPTLANAPGSVRDSEERVLLAFLDPETTAEQDTKLQISRSLDEYYYHALKDDERDRRNRDQVIYRFQIRKAGEDSPEALICMVDQMWLYIVDERTVITCFPRRWREVDRVRSLQEEITDHIIKQRDIRPQCFSVNQMALLITSICISFGLKLEIRDKKERLLQAFAATIGDKTNDEVGRFEKFKDEIEKHKKNPEITDQTSDIAPEINLLEEIKDVLDELNIIKIVLDKQADLFQQLTDLVMGTGAYRLAETSAEKGFVAYYRELSGIDDSTREVERMIENAKATYVSINHLLDLRQKNANLQEAAWSRKASQDATKQQRTIMVFTIVTIIFLPMSFLTSLFALNIAEFPHSQTDPSSDPILVYTSKWAFGRIFGFTAAIAGPLVILALSINRLQEISKIYPYLRSRRVRKVVKDEESSEHKQLS